MKDLYHTKNWWIPMLAVLVTGAAGLLFMGVRTYQDAPPIPTMTAPTGEVVASKDMILDGQNVFLEKALMEYGSMFGDGGMRGPDYSADALHETARAMKAFYHAQWLHDHGREATQLERDGIEARVKREIKENRYDADLDTLPLNEAQAYAFHRLGEHFRRKFKDRGHESMRPTGYLADDAQIARLSAFFFWSGWVCGAKRPGEKSSYTHNWPYDPTAGNEPSPTIMVWSVIGALGLVLGLGLVLYLYGRWDPHAGWQTSQSEPVATNALVGKMTPTPTQRASYKFFAVAALLFLVQVLGGVLTIHDFVGFTTFFGFDLATVLPLPVTRAWHVQLSVLWIATCWIAGAIYLLPRIAGSEPRGQLALVNLLFLMLVGVVVGMLAGNFLGPQGYLGDSWRLLGTQGWEFVELGKLWQGLLFAALLLWVVIVVRGVRPALSGLSFFSLPYWMLYSVVTISFLFLSSFIATPRTNFVIADFWRWCVIHMWAECFFEVFTTVVVAYFLHFMGLVTKTVANRVVFLSVLLFLGSGFLGISHNFYWNAKPMATLAIGSVFSTLQVVPLIILTLEAWRMRRMPGERAGLGSGADHFGLSEAFLFMVAVNFWNFFGAGVFGFIINLPIMNYYEHGTYLTVNHGHAALMGVYGNLSIACMLFCARHLVKPERWAVTPLRVSFWSLNLGLLLMVLLDTFPAGLMQFAAVVEEGYAYARSQAFVLDTPFQTLTWMRLVGGALFVLGGILPLCWVLVSRWGSLKAAAPVAFPRPE